MSTAIASALNQDFTLEVREIFAQVTRYPLDILDPESSLEEDLGIDSVKLGEVFAVLREKYRLSDTLQIPRESLRSIQSVTESLRMHLTSHVTSSMPLPAAAPVVEDRETEIRKVFADVTRYPLEILEPHASLEEDLGIDSVKLGEIFAVLREKYDLPVDAYLPREEMKTIAGIADSLSKYLSARGEQLPRPAALLADPKPVSGDLARNILKIFAEVTRYPEDILEPSASLEEDLGVDSVKLGEVFAVLRERYHLPVDLDIPREEMKSIGAITRALETYLGASSVSAAPAVAPSHPTPMPSMNGHSKAFTNGDALRAHAYTNGNGHVKHAPGVMETSFTGLSPERRPFDGKIALVTGSGRALGKDIAVYLASLGATVIVNSFHSREQGAKTVEEITSAGGKAVHYWGSVANPQHLEAIFEQVEKNFGALDFFVNNASNGMLARLEDLTVEHWEKAFRTNVIGLHQCAVRAVNLMKRRGGGKIITLSSPASHGYVDYFGCMGAVKAAVESLTKSMAIEFAPYNVTVNCVSPGPIYGDLLNKWPESKRLIAEWEQATVIDRLCVDRDVSHFIAYLLSEPVKLFTGSVLVMDGGISVRWGGVSSARENSPLGDRRLEAFA